MNGNLAESAVAESGHFCPPSPGGRPAGREGVGFEPTVPIRHNGFRDRPIRPLSHPSVRNSIPTPAGPSLRLRAPGSGGASRVVQVP